MADFVRHSFTNLLLLVFIDSSHSSQETKVDGIIERISKRKQVV